MQPLFADNLEAITSLLLISCFGLSVAMPVIGAVLYFSRPEQAVYASFTAFFSQAVCLVFFSSRVGLSGLSDLPPLGCTCSCV